MTTSTPQIESVFIFDKAVWRIDGAAGVGSFWAERLSEKLDSTEDYREFPIDCLIKYQGVALIMATRETDFL